MNMDEYWIILNIWILMENEMVIRCDFMMVSPKIWWNHRWNGVFFLCCEMRKFLGDVSENVHHCGNCSGWFHANIHGNLIYIVKELYTLGVILVGVSPVIVAGWEIPNRNRCFNGNIIFSIATFFPKPGGYPVVDIAVEATAPDPANRTLSEGFRGCAITRKNHERQGTENIFSKLVDWVRGTFAHSIRLHQENPVVWPPNAPARTPPWTTGQVHLEGLGPDMWPINVPSGKRLQFANWKMAQSK